MCCDSATRLTGCFLQLTDCLRTTTCHVHSLCFQINIIKLLYYFAFVHLLLKRKILFCMHLFECRTARKKAARTLASFYWWQSQCHASVASLLFPTIVFVYYALLFSYLKIEIYEYICACITFKYRIGQWNILGFC